MLVVGLPDSGYGGRSVRVYQADQTGTFHERLNVTAPSNGPGGSRFGAQVLCLLQYLQQSFTAFKSYREHGHLTNSAHAVRSLKGAFPCG